MPSSDHSNKPGSVKPHVNVEAYVGAVPDKDAAILEALGHHEELERQFSFPSLAAFAVVTGNAWTTVAGVLVTAIYNGGAPGMLYSWIVGNFFYFFIALSLAELVSAMPTAGGVYHWSTALSGPKYGRFVGFITGYVSILGWVIGMAGLFSVTGNELLGLYRLYHENYVYHRWHVFVMYITLTAIYTCFIQYGHRILPLYNNVFLFLYLSVWIVTIVILAAKSSNHSSNDFVWRTYENLTGWPSGVCFIAGLSGITFAIGTIDASTHMTEEVPHPGRTVPKVIMIHWGSSAILGFVFLIALFYAVPDLNTILSANPNFVTGDIYRAAMGRPTALALGSLLIVASLPCSIGAQIATVRTLWAFSRDGAVPFSGFFSKVTEADGMPARANALVAVVTALIGIIYVASDTAFNALISSYSLLSSTSLMLGIGAHMFTGRKNIVPGWFHLGHGIFGWIVNGIAFSYILVTNIFFCFPYTAPPVSAETMNYTSLVSYGLVVLVLLWWVVGGRKNFKGPKTAHQTVEELAAIQAVQFSG